MKMLGLIISLLGIIVFAYLCFYLKSKKNMENLIANKQKELIGQSMIVSAKNSYISLFAMLVLLLGGSSVYFAQDLLLTNDNKKVDSSCFKVENSQYHKIIYQDKEQINIIDDESYLFEIETIINNLATFDNCGSVDEAEILILANDQKYHEYQVVKNCLIGKDANYLLNDEQYHQLLDLLKTKD